jgi:hypothetical protein
LGEGTCLAAAGRPWRRSPASSRDVKLHALGPWRLAESSPKPASTGRSRGVQLERVQRSPRQVGRGRVDGSDALKCVADRAVSPTVGEGEPRASMHVSPLRATMSKTARRRSSTPDGRSSEGVNSREERAAGRAESPMAGKEGEPRAPQCAMPPRTPRTKHPQHAGVVRSSMRGGAQGA